MEIACGMCERKRGKAEEAAAAAEEKRMANWRIRRRLRAG